MDLPLPDWGSRSRPQPDGDAEPPAVHQSNPSTTHRNHDSRLSNAAAATIRSLPPEQGQDPRPSGPNLTESQARTSRHSRDHRSRSPDDEFESRSEIAIQRPPTIIGSLPPRKGPRGVPPDMKTRVSHSQHGRSRSTNSQAGPRSQAPHSMSRRYDASTYLQDRFGEGSPQRSPNTISRPSQGDRSPSHDNEPRSRSISPTHRTHSQRSARRSQARPRPGSHGYYLDEESATGYTGTRLTSESRAPSIMTDTRDTRSPRRRKRAYRLPWRRREASRCLQRAVAICTIALVALVILLIVLEFTVFRKKPAKPQTS